ncbi:Uncharacterised protein [Pseudomonas putida]|uniref:hypothetical protein n=1 Tax=Pseudomonas guariconensis TaxID=1288410 RepID=UPI001F954D82|nr:hypothetical protein [Pseudomonas guariconensis]CAB5584497.1 Uncharacterised protein [Pseudomonas putida]MDM9594685.1 hypothetical protein [Pseudomonas guariconensis]MDM9607515.1 hypothetical protein [Pseudomonas guariconensis]CAB5588696.1 Uncharacterised protein [Pseudomonas putida]CAB5629061.1 Uncharacterised protein [Pseudomonas putida]
MSIKATCAACGSDQLEVPQDDDQDQMVRCGSCKADVGDKASIQKLLKQKAEEEAAKLVAGLKKSLSKIGFK